MVVSTFQKQKLSESNGGWVDIITFEVYVFSIIDSGVSLRNIDKLEKKGNLFRLYLSILFTLSLCSEHFTTFNNDITIQIMEDDVTILISVLISKIPNVGKCHTCTCICINLEKKTLCSHVPLPSPPASPPNRRDCLIV